jgi:endoglycosylceramidase
MNSALLIFIIIFIIIASLIFIKTYNFIFQIIRAFKTPKKNNNTYYKDKFNRVMFFRGVNICNHSKNSFNLNPWHSNFEYKMLETFGFNLVRCLVLWEGIEPEKDKYNESYLDKISEHIELLKKHNISVIIGIHQNLYNRCFGGKGFPYWTLPDNIPKYNIKDKKQFNYFHKDVIKSYRNFWKSHTLKKAYISMVCFLNHYFEKYDNIIGIDVFNEPFSICSNFEKRILIPFYKEMIITASTESLKIPLYFQPSLLSKLGIPSNIRKNSLFPGSKFIPHYYPPLLKNKGIYCYLCKFLTEIGIKSKIREAQDLRTPAILGEFGISNKIKGFKEFIEDIKDISNEYHLNWIWNSFDKEEHSEYGILDNDGVPNSTAYLLSQIYPRKIAGKNIYFYNKNNIFYLEYIQTSMTLETEIYIPPWLRRYQCDTNCNLEKKINLILLHHNERGKQYLKIKYFTY